LRTSTFFSDMSVMINGTRWSSTPHSNLTTKWQLLRISC